MYMQESVADKKKRPNFIMREDQTTKYIPLDVVERILSKLPTKAVLRFATVSKSWSAAIFNPRFGRIHRNTACNNDDDQLFLWPSHDSGNIYHLGRFKGLQLDAILSLQSPIERTNPPPLCSCDGLFLIYDAAHKICALWNPITRSKMCFAYPETTMNSPDQTTHGICYDPLEDDYKVIFVNVRSFLYTVFSCGNNSWTEPKQFPPYKHIKGDPGVSVGGVPYWVVVPDDEIVYFDARDCGFKSKPHKANASGHSSLKDGRRLCLCEYPWPTLSLEKFVRLLEQEHSARTLLQLFPCASEADIVQSGGGANSSLFVTGGPTPFIICFGRNNQLAWHCHMTSQLQSFAVQASLVVLPTSPKKIL